MWRLRARWTLLDVVQAISHTKSGGFSTCFIDSAIFYLFPILSHVFRYLFIISSSVLEQAGFSEIITVSMCKDVISKSVKSSVDEKGEDFGKTCLLQDRGGDDKQITENV